MKEDGPPQPNDESTTAVIPATFSSTPSAEHVARPDEPIHLSPTALTEPVRAVSTEPSPAVPQTSVFDVPTSEQFLPTAASVQSVVPPPRSRARVPRWTKALAAITLVFAVMTLVLLLSTREDGRATSDGPQDDRSTAPSSATQSSASTSRTAPIAANAAAIESTEPVAPSTSPPRSTIVATSAATTAIAPSTVTRTAVPQASTTTVATTPSTTATAPTTASTTTSSSRT